MIETMDLVATMEVKRLILNKLSIFIRNSVFYLETKSVPVSPGPNTKMPPPPAQLQQPPPQPGQESQPTILWQCNL